MLAGTNFIYERYLNDLSICDDIIDHHKNSIYSKRGYSGGAMVTQDKASKDLGLYVEKNPANNPKFLIKYLNELYNIVDEYAEKFYFSAAEVDDFEIDRGINIQYYKPKEGYFNWHNERPSSMKEIVRRHLVFMTYLNDVENGGTEFYYQKVKTQAKKGLTLIWPADWTHTHRGVISNNQEKYIITGWFSFKEPNKE